MHNSLDFRADFPIFDCANGDTPFAFLDTAASAQKPRCVIETMNEVYAQSYANIHRGNYKLSEKITSLYENSRKSIANFLNAQSKTEIIFTRNATEAINLVATCFAGENLKVGDEVLISEAEHHANLVPWQMICKKTGASLQVFKISDDGSYIKEEFEKKLNRNTKIVAITAMSNVLGNTFPIKEICKKAKEFGATTLIDACQFAVHHKIDVKDIDCDFLTFSGHKVYGPTGIGILYGKKEILNSMPPYQFGGDMVDRVTYESTTFAPIPAKFEAGTPAIVEAIGLAKALEYIENIGFENITKKEKELSEYMISELSKIDGLTIVGRAKDKLGVFSFKIDGVHDEDASFILSKENISVRTGHHCAEPLVNRLGYKSLIRASIGIYSNKEDIDMLIRAIYKVKSFFRK